MLTVECFQNSLVQWTGNDCEETLIPESKSWLWASKVQSNLYPGILSNRPPRTPWEGRGAGGLVGPTPTYVASFPYTSAISEWQERRGGKKTSP